MTYDPGYKNDTPESIHESKFAWWLGSRSVMANNRAMLTVGNGTQNYYGAGHIPNDTRQSQRPVLYLNNL